MHQKDWQKSSFSSSSGECIEVRTFDGVVEMRESDSESVIIRTTPVDFAKFLKDVKVGEFDHHAALWA
ncbi:DUF397 domain-containing protein [Kitasatospora sp. NPDC001527]|uniref:DUF397 domain-containing protein n=1 Tax=Kitasatospora sp. NPDC001527 TaxID=3154519 RepID=UPI00331E273B